MPTLLVIRCNDCGGKFRIPEQDKWPDFCPSCGVYCGVDPDFVPTQMNIGTVKGKSADRVYREMEAASIARAEMAGDPSLKMTDMKDNLREGDIAYKGPQPSQEYLNHTAQIGAQAEYMPNVQGLAGMARQGVQGDGSYAMAAIQGGSPGPGLPALPVIPGAGFGGGFTPA